jgi:type I restriction enzyme M protein
MRFYAGPRLLIIDEVGYLPLAGEAAGAPGGPFTTRRTDHVWFYDLQADGRSLDDKRTPLLANGKLGATSVLAAEEHAKNNLPDALARWRERDGSEADRARTDQSFCVPKADIAANDYDLSINRYKEIVYDEIEYQAPSEILDDLTALEEEIQKGIDNLKAMLS